MTTHWEAIVSRNHQLDGTFVYAVKTTGVFCRPSCPARRPRPENVQYYAAAEEAQAAGYRACKRCSPTTPRCPEAGLIEAACRFIEKHAEGFQLNQLAKHMGYSQFHLQRTFKAALGITPRAYAETQRITAMKQSLRANRPVTEALYDAGFSSPSRVYENAGQHFGMTPANYRKQGRGLKITFTTVSTSLGLLLVAQTERGVCSLTFGDSEQAVENALRAEFPAADLSRAPSPHVDAVIAHLNGTEHTLRLPLDIEATAFQRRVWEQLQKIPYGETRSYSDIARAMEQPQAFRAVARACATNPVALAIPCHRVVREGGAQSGYRWGLHRKELLLKKERE